MKECLRAEHLAVGYGEEPLIEDICIRVRKGEIVTLIGPNGSGKSTVLKTIIRRLKPMGGTVSLSGISMEEMGGKEVARRMAAVMTDSVRPELMTCREVAAAGRYPYTGLLGILGAEDKRKADQALAAVHGEDIGEKDFREVSDGQKQRILLARAICQEPEVLVLDEPTSFLDIRYKRELLDILKQMARKGTGVLLSLHELDLAQKLSDYVICVKGRKIWRCGPPEEIFASSVISGLYEIEKESFYPETGCAELPSVSGKPEIFVIGGNGRGIPVYRRLQRRGIPFAAGILWENDLDVPVARALASRVIVTEPFEPIGTEAWEQAKELADSCERVICCLERFGSWGKRNRELAERAGDKLTDWRTI